MSEEPTSLHMVDGLLKYPCFILMTICFSVLLVNTAKGMEIQSDTLEEFQIESKSADQTRSSYFRFIQQRTHVQLGFVRAYLHTDVIFETNLLLQIKLGLEDNLGLPGERSFVTTSVIHRFTPRSGVYAQYYGINRQIERDLREDIVFLRDTIPAGTRSLAYFNTQVFSPGYLLTIKESSDLFFASYFNLYFMWLKTGVKSEIGNIDKKVTFIAPLPNFGLFLKLKLLEWLYFETNAGFFSLYTKGFDGTVYDFNARFVFKPIKNLGIGISYQEFDVRIDFPSHHVNTVVDYNFRGPSLSLMGYF